MERLLWEFHLLSLCRRPLELLRGEELHWSCSKKVNAKPTTRTRATGFTLHQKTLPLTLRNCRTHPSGISNVKYTQRNHSAAETDGLLTLRSVRTDRPREKKKNTLQALCPSAGRCITQDLALRMHPRRAGGEAPCCVSPCSHCGFPGESGDLLGTSLLQTGCSKPPKHDAVGPREQLQAVSERRVTHVQISS